MKISKQTSDKYEMNKYIKRKEKKSLFLEHILHFKLGRGHATVNLKETGTLLCSELALSMTTFRFL